MPGAIKPPPASALLRELFTPVQIPLLLAQFPWLALAPRGRGRVLVWPGFGASNASTLPIRNYLSYLGYEVEGWPLGRNNGDVLAMLAALTETLEDDSSAEPVTLVGWSLGGYLAREVARDCPDRVRRVVTLGSPVVGGPKYTAVAPMFAGDGTSLDEIEALVEARYEKPLRVPVTAIYSKADGVVAWQACIDERSPGVEHVEVLSSHAGLGVSGAAFRVLAERLAV